VSIAVFLSQAARGRIGKSYAGEREREREREIIVPRESMKLSLHYPADFYRILHPTLGSEQKDVL
jgi:hypothetical protein